MESRAILEPYFIREIPSLPIYKARVDEEFALIERFGFTKVFEQVYTILQIAKRLSIPHIIRGSAGSSLICFLMGITEIDPLHWKLELARFMNTGRTDLPDIDIDVPYNRREQLYQEIEKQWPSMVARISNHVRYGSSVAVRTVAKQAYLTQIPTQVELRSHKEKLNLRRLNRKQPALEKVFSDKAQVAEIKQEAKKKIGTLHHHSKHCGGIVIFEEEGKIPEDLLLESTGDMPQIHLNKDETEDAGYIKIDLLSNRGLAQLVDAQDVPRGLLEYPERDPLTEHLLRCGNTLGVTFAESRGMRKLFLGMKPRHMDDIAILLALIRPAAATQGRKREFLERWRYGAEQQDPLSKQIIFDDDAIAIVKAALGCESAEADKWRKVFAKGNPAGRVQFRQCLIQKGHSRAVQEYLMSELDYLALYSFCKSHAVSYAQLVWALAYEKAHNPHRFWLAALNHCHSQYRKWVYYREAKCSGLRLPRDPPPYVLTSIQGQPALRSPKAQGTQVRLTQMFGTEDPVHQDFAEMKELGYWRSDRFLAGCGMWPESQQPLERWFGTSKDQRQTSVRFRGLIATGRVLRRDGLVTLLTIGVANQHFLDLVIPDVDQKSLFQSVAVEGRGTYEKQGGVEMIQVDTIHGISLHQLSLAQGST